MYDFILRTEMCDKCGGTLVLINSTGTPANSVVCL